MILCGHFLHNASKTVIKHIFSDPLGELCRPHRGLLGGNVSLSSATARRRRRRRTTTTKRTETSPTLNKIKAAAAKATDKRPSATITTTTGIAKPE